MNEIDLSEAAEALALEMWDEEAEGFAFADLDAGQQVMVKDAILPLIQAVLPSIAAQAWDAAADRAADPQEGFGIRANNPWRTGETSGD